MRNAIERATVSATRIEILLSESLAIRESKSERSIRMTLSLAFISPVLAEAAMEGRLPRGFCVKRLTDLPVLCSEQWRAVGLQQPIQTQAEPI